MMGLLACNPTENPERPVESVRDLCGPHEHRYKVLLSVMFLGNACPLPSWGPLLSPSSGPRAHSNGLGVAGRAALRPVLGSAMREQWGLGTWAGVWD